MSFSAVVLLCGPQTLSVCSGVYAVRAVEQGAIHVLYRPRLLRDEFIDQGHLTREEVNAFPHGDIYVGPLLGVSAQLVVVEQEMRPGDRVVVSHYLRESNDFDAIVRRTASARQVAAAMKEGSHPFPAVVATSA